MLLISEVFPLKQGLNIGRRVVFQYFAGLILCALAQSKATLDLMPREQTVFQS